MVSGTTIDQEEVTKFSKMAEEWWNPEGSFKPLHRFNPTRIAYLRAQMQEHFGLNLEEVKPFKGLKLLDIGCGGGLLSEPMARMGADVTGIDASEKNIKIAGLHAEQSDLTIDYRQTTAEKLADEMPQHFDVVLNMEVVEHVSDVPLFLQSSAKLVKPGGVMCVATLNRTAKSFLFAIVGAEYVLRWLPKGTHEWQKFLKPSEVAEQVQQAGLRLKKSSGVTFNPLSQQWALSRDMMVNYMQLYSKSC